MKLFRQQGQLYYYLFSLIKYPVLSKEYSSEKYVTFTQIPRNRISKKDQLFDDKWLIIRRKLSFEFGLGLYFRELFLQTWVWICAGSFYKLSFENKQKQ